MNNYGPRRPPKNNGHNQFNRNNYHNNNHQGRSQSNKPYGNDQNGQVLKNQNKFPGSSIDMSVPPPPMYKPPAPLTPTWVPSIARPAVMPAAGVRAPTSTAGFIWGDQQMEMIHQKPVMDEFSWQEVPVRNPYITPRDIQPQYFVPVSNRYGILSKNV